MDTPCLYCPLRTLASFNNDADAPLIRHTQAYIIFRDEGSEVVNLTPKPRLADQSFFFIHGGVRLNPLSTAPTTGLRTKGCFLFSSWPLTCLAGRLFQVD
jgi:hypothetical protein